MKKLTSKITSKSHSLLSDVEFAPLDRIITGIQGFDRVIGGGLVPGSVTVISGAPDIGKSTLLHQIAKQLAKQKIEVLCVSGEETLEQVASRAKRLEVRSSYIKVAKASNIEDILDLVEEHMPDVFIIDSIQTIEVEHCFPGSASAIKIAGEQLLRFCKNSEFAPACLIIAHVTKNEGFAGPNALMHAADTCISLEKDKELVKLSCNVKNRYGSCSQRSYFYMTEKGFVQ